MILYEIRNKIGHITLSSGKGNLLNDNDIESLRGIVSTTKNDDSVCGLMIFGRNHCFSTGLQVSEVPTEKLNSFFAKFDNLLLELFAYQKPLVVVIDGHSIGGGLLLQCCADYVVAANNPKIKIGLPELKIGLTIDELMTSLLKFNTGNVKVIQQLLYNGEYITVDRAMDLGFIDCLTEPDDALSKASIEIDKLINYDKTAFQITKLRLRAHTIQRMSNAINNKCYEIFNELK